jgi:2-oxoisovalerate dehydrogenase E2 component (dihydrolipoyl transacylase)
VPDLKQFRLPDVGEGLTEADILSWTVAPGDVVVVNQTLVEVETAKAAVELPSPFAGVVHSLHAEVGETVEVGRPIITIDVDPGGSPAPTSAPLQASEPLEGERQAVLVGYGPRSGATTRRTRRAPAEHEPVPTAQPSFARVGTQTGTVNSAPTTPQPAGPAAVTAVQAPSTDAALSSTSVLAKPPVRKLAKDLGVDLASVAATGPNGSVSREDVQRALATAAVTPSGVGPEERIPVKGVRKHTAAAMVASAFTAPHVTEFITIDVTATMELRDRIAARRDFADTKVSPLLLLARAIMWAAKRTPMINSSWDEAAGEIVVKHYVNLGIAAATGRGLVVPNIKNADSLSLRDLAGRLDELVATARTGKTSPADMSGGTITITNVGVFGIDTGTPILNPGEAAIVAFGAVRRAPWVIERAGVETIEPRWVTQLSVSFDHRIIDGEAGSRFLADVASVLIDPGLMML